MNPIPKRSSLRCLVPVAALVAACLQTLTQAAEGEDDNPGADPQTIEASIADKLGSNPADDLFWEALILLQAPSEKDREAGAAKLREAADRDHPVALRIVGEMHLSGSFGFQRSQRRAFQALLASAEAGYSPSKVLVGVAYHRGIGTHRNREQARRWFEAALADATTFERPTPPKWYFEKLRAAIPGTDESLIDDTEDIPEWEQLCATSHFALGEICDAEKDQAAATAHFESAATWGRDGRAGIYQAATRAAMRYALGRGVTGNLERANELLDHSRHLLHRRLLGSVRAFVMDIGLDDLFIDTSDAFVESTVGETFSEDQQAVANTLLKDRPAEAARWCELAAESGETWAMLLLGELHFTGRLGTADREAAFRWYERAAREKDSDLAWGNLAACHRFGLGTAVDLDTAAQIVRERGESNFICMLVGAGAQPPPEMTVAAWRRILDDYAEAGRPIEALYHRAVLKDREATKPTSPGSDFLGRRKGPDAVFKDMQRAAEAGLGAAHFELGIFYQRGRHVAMSGEAARAEFVAGMEAGHSGCANEIGFNALQLARRTHNLTHLETAISSFKLAIKLDPKNAMAHNNLAAAYETLLREPTALSNPEHRKACSAAMIRSYEAAITHGSSLAAINLGKLYFYGGPIPQDYQLAYTHLQEASEADVIAAHLLLGRMHDQGRGVPETPKEAVSYYRLAAFAGNTDAILALARCYDHGRGVPRDLHRAAYWYFRLGWRRDWTITIRLGDIYSELGMKTEVMRFWKSINTYSEGMLAAAANERLSRIYEEGIGTRPNARRAASHFKKALEAGDPDALCREGVRLVEKGDVDEGLTMLGRARQAGSRGAACELARLKLAGQVVPRDTATAVALLREGAAAYHTPSMIALAQTTLDGIAEAPDLEEALRIIDAAARAGAADTTAVRKALEALHDKALEQPVTDDSRVRSA